MSLIELYIRDHKEFANILMVIITIVSKIFQKIPPTSAHFKYYLPSANIFQLPSIVGNKIIEIAANFGNKSSLDSDGLSLKFMKHRGGLPHLI